MRRLPLRARDQSVRAYALIDDEDFWRLGEFRWSLHSEGYAYRALPGGGTQLLHRAVLSLTPGDGLEADHRNHDRLDCQRENLRITTRKGNAQNQPARGGSSRFRGVSWHRRLRRWQAQAQLDGRHMSAGLYATELEAALAIDAKRRELMPFAEPDPELVRALEQEAV